MKILALDTATRTGWAVYSCGIVTSGVIDCSIRTKPTVHIEADHPGKRFALFNDWLRNQMRDDKIDLVVYESVVGGHNAGGKAALIQKGLEALVLLQAFDRAEPVPVWNFAAGTIKKWATGSGLLTHESKAEMVRLAFMQFKDQEWEQTSKGLDDNQADALWILDLTRAVIAQISVSGDPMDSVWPSDLTEIARRVTTAKWPLVKKH